jgi:hypothetical protein
MVAMDLPLEKAIQVNPNPNGTKNKLSMVVFSGDMDKVMAGFIIATGAAASGMDVTMFFTFWGLKAIQKPGALTGKGLFGRMLGVMNRGGQDDALPDECGCDGNRAEVISGQCNRLGRCCHISGRSLREQDYTLYLTNKEIF